MNNPQRDAIIVIPALNEEEGIGQVLDSVYAKLNGYAYEVLVVDGRSKDSTVQIAKDKGAIVIYQKERGYGDALRTGMEYAVFHFDTKTIVLMDADGSCDLKDVPALIKPILEGKADLVNGNRLLAMKEGAMKPINRFGNRLISMTMRICYGLDVKDVCSGMKALESDLVRKLSLEVKDWPLMSEILAKAWWLEARILEIPISYNIRLGESKLQRFKAALDNIKIILKNRFPNGVLLSNKAHAKYNCNNKS